MKTKAFILPVSVFVAVAAIAKTVTEPIFIDGTYDLVVTEGTELTATAVIGGAGDFHVKANAGYVVVFNNANTAVGNFYVDGGIAHVMTPAALGTGTVYVNDESAGGSNRRQLHVYNDATITNNFVLGSEETTGWQERFMSRDGSVVYTGKFNVDRSKIAGYNGTSRFRGGIEGLSYVTIFPMQNSDGQYAGHIYVENNPIRVGGALQVQGPSFAGRTSAFHLDVTGNEYGKLTLFNYALVVCGEDGALAPAAQLYAYTDGGTVDLNGTTQSAGSIVTGGAANAPIRFVNGNLAQKASLTLTQDTDITDGLLALYGYIDFTKAGDGSLGTSEPVAIEGTLTVSAGRLTLNGTPVRLLADTVRLTGGTLDLGGKTWRCRTFEYVSGAIVNGTLVSDRQVVACSGDYAPAATVLGDIEVQGNVRVMSKTAMTRTRTTTDYALPEGTAVYFTFDSEDADGFLKDFGPSDTRLLVAPNGAGTVTRSSPGVQGTSGSLYLDGTTYLQSEAFPSELTAGTAPYTISFWVKTDSGCSPNVSLLGYGLPASDDAKLQSVYFQFVNWGAGDFSTIDEAFYGADVATVRDGGLFFNDGWHHFVGVYLGNGGSVRLYVDGEKKCDWPVGVVDIARQFLRVGKGTVENSASFKGWLDEMLIVNRALSDDEIASLYAAPPARTEKTVKPSVSVTSGTLSSAMDGVVYMFDSEAALLTDSSGNGATLQVAHGSVGEYAKFSGETAHSSGGSLYLDGKTYLTLAGTFPSAIPVGHAAVSICIRFKADADCFNGAGIIGWGAGEVNNGNYTLNFNNWNSGQYYQRLFFSRYGADTLALLEDAKFNDGDWHTAVVTYDGSFQVNGGIKMYVDGQLLSSDTMWSYPQVTAENFCIGAIPYSKYGPDHTQNFKGYIDDVAIYPYVISEAEVQAYHGGAPSTEKPLKLAEDTELAIAADTTVSLDASDVTVASLSGAGTFVCRTLSVTDSIETGTTVSGDLTLENGIRTVIGEGPTVVSGTVTVDGTGTVVLPTGIELPYGVTLYSGASVFGGANLVGWTGDNLPRRTTVFKTFVDRSSIKVLAVKPGMFIYIR